MPAMLSMRAAYTPAFSGVTRSRLRVRADVGAAHSDGDARTDSNGEVWTYETGTELPGGKIRASTNGYNSSGSSLYSGYTTNWYSIDFFSRESGVDAFIDAYAVANAGASKAAKSTTSSGGGGGTKKPAPSSGGGKVAVKPDTVATEIASDNSWLIAIGAGVAVFLTVLIFKAPI